MPFSAAFAVQFAARAIDLFVVALIFTALT
jgi:hypothetical protein